MQIWIFNFIKQHLIASVDSLAEDVPALLYSLEVNLLQSYLKRWFLSSSGEVISEASQRWPIILVSSGHIFLEWPALLEQKSNKRRQQKSIYIIGARYIVSSSVSKFSNGAFDSKRRRLKWPVARANLFVVIESHGTYSFTLTWSEQIRLRSYLD